MISPVTPPRKSSRLPSSLLRLFRPGSGVEPPLLAGRAAPLQEFKLLLSNLQARRNPPRDVVLYGPRGNGKTALLNVFRNICRRAGIDVVSLTPERLANNAELASRLLYNDTAEIGNLLQGLRPDTLSVKAPLLGEANWRQLSPDEQDRYQTRHLESLLAARCQNNPLVVAVDEAHMLDIEVGRALLNLSQNLRGEHTAPFLLVLAGTPNLEMHLSRIGATFWDRAKVMGIGILSPEATREALVKPLADYEITFEEESLARVTDESQQYPYFVQEWGQALCQAIFEAGKLQIDTAILNTAKPIFQKAQAVYYGRRYREIEAQGLLPAAAAVARAFRSEELLDADTMTERMSASLPEAIQPTTNQTINQLADLGYIWRQPDSVLWERGIPSLMDYVANL